MHFYKLPLSDIVVFHDELDLPPGQGASENRRRRRRPQWLALDHRPRRQRLPAGADRHRPSGVKDLVHGYVLTDFSKSERDWVAALTDIVADNAELLAQGQDASFQNKVHLAMDAKGFGPLASDDQDAD